MGLFSDRVAAKAVPTRSHLNPRSPQGATAYRPRDIAYVVEAPNTNAHRRISKFLVVTSDSWLSGWEVGKKVRMATATSTLDVKVTGIVDFATATVEGTIPSLRLPHWRAQKIK